MIVRAALTAIDNNKNLSRDQAVTAEGEKKFSTVRKR
jgi:hypothetical protein